MDHTVSREQAAAFVRLFPRCCQLTVGSNDPTAELPLGQLRVCRVLTGGLQSISAISRELGVSLMAITQIADRLERARLVRRLTEDNDRRVRCLQLTARGEKLLRLHDEDRVRRMAAASTVDSRRKGTGRGRARHAGPRVDGGAGRRRQ